MRKSSSAGDSMVQFINTSWKNFWMIFHLEILFILLIIDCLVYQYIMEDILTILDGAPSHDDI